MRLFSFIILFIYFSTEPATAQPLNQPNSSEILLALQKLNTVGSVLYVAAHPDDENTRLLGFLSKEMKLRTAYISITRGDGGQNLIGKEQGDLLGLIRTQELLAARKTDGAEQFFTRANDFGYSKNPEETFAFWNKDSILADLVWVIRNFKPDVIITRFPTNGDGGHGHHTASAILALEAFDAAADPKRFPQQLAFTQVWQAKRLFWNKFNPGGNNPPPAERVKLDVGTFNPLLGKGFGEIAAESRSMHKSQGFGSAKTRGTNIENFVQLKGDSVKSEIFEDINLHWNRLNGMEHLQVLIDSCIENYNLLSPENSVPALLQIYNQLKKIDEGNSYSRYWKYQKLMETEQLLLSCAGLWMEAGASDYIGYPGGNVSITSQIICRNKCNTKLNSINFFNATDTTTQIDLKYNELVTIKHEEKLSQNLAVSSPYWLNEKHDIGSFKISNPLLIGSPENKSPLNVIFRISINGVEMNIERPLVYKQTDPVKGEVYRPFEILPIATVNISEKVFVFSDTKPKNVRFTVKANIANVSGLLIVNLPDGWSLDLKNYDFNLKNKGDEAVFEGKIHPGNLNGNATVKASLIIYNVVYSNSIQRIEYDHIPFQFILSDAESKLVGLNLKKTVTSIGYIPGAGDEIPSCLAQIGYQVTTLTDELLSTADISVFPVIVTGIRAYNTNDRLQVHYEKLMDYVKGGGNLIVQYNTNSRVGPVKAKIGPYPFTISRDRVTDEHAEVRMIKKDHPVLSTPNKISEDDFNNWIQERGIYFATEVDSNYQQIFSMNDKGEKPVDGSLIIGKYGKGNFVYTGLAFFRELPAGVPGAYRLFVNLLSLPQNK